MTKPLLSSRPVLSTAGLATILLALVWPANDTLTGQTLGDLARPQSGRSMRATSTMRAGEVRRGGAERKLDPKADPRAISKKPATATTHRVPPGETHVLLDDEGPGVITHIWITFLGPEPQGWAPAGLRQSPGDAAAHVLGRQRAPRRRGAGGRFLRQLLRPAPRGHQPAGGRRGRRFLQLLLAHAVSEVGPDRDRQPERQAHQPALLQHRLDQEGHRCRRTRPTSTPSTARNTRCEKGKDYVVLDTTGKGHYVGTVLAVRTRSPAWFGEGDEKIYIDGEAKPSIWGTGTEDYFLSAWGLKTTSTPYFGVPYFDQWGIVGGHTSAYRWHINDPLVFNTGIKVTFEHFGWISPDENPDYKSTSWNEREDDYASVAFWYQTGEPTFTARAPHARERRLPSLERLVVYARDFADAAHHGAGEATPQHLDLYEGAATALRARQAEGAWLEIPFEVAQQGAAAAAAQRDQGRRFRPVPGLPQRREAGRPGRLLQGQGGQRRGPPARLLA